MADKAASGRLTLEEGVEMPLGGGFIENVDDNVELAVFGCLGETEENC
jgi:hypothetical protein